MPELPEVHTTVEGLKKKVLGKTIRDVWSDFYVGTSRSGSRSVKNKKYFETLRNIATGAKIKSVERKGKNILINLSPSGSGQGYSIVVHMKMTGHLMVGKYRRVNKRSEKGAGGAWVPLEKGPLQDPYNKYIHFVFTLTDGSSRDQKHLVLSDARKFASVTISKTAEIHYTELGKLGPDALMITRGEFSQRIRARKGTVKSVLTDQTALAGIGNIYSDEILWTAGVHPLSNPAKIPEKKYGEMFEAMRKILRFSIRLGGDSRSDYRNVKGEKGGFQKFHKAYGRSGLRCPKPRCLGIIERLTVKGRSAHFCPKHQILYK